MVFPAPLFLFSFYSSPETPVTQSRPLESFLSLINFFSLFLSVFYFDSFDSYVFNHSILLTRQEGLLNKADSCRRSLRPVTTEHHGGHGGGWPITRQLRWLRDRVPNNAASPQTDPTWVTIRSASERPEMGKKEWDHRKTEDSPSWWGNQVLSDLSTLSPPHWTDLSMMGRDDCLSFPDKCLVGRIRSGYTFK